MNTIQELVPVLQRISCAKLSGNGDDLTLDLFQSFLVHLSNVAVLLLETLDTAIQWICDLESVFAFCAV